MVAPIRAIVIQDLSAHPMAVSMSPGWIFSCALLVDEFYLPPLCAS